MRVVLASLVLVAGVAGVAGAAVAGAAGSAATKHTALTITYWLDEQAPKPFERWTLRCNPVGGTLPARKAACRRLARLAPGAFARVPSDAICTQIYGGPQKAVVKGTVAGKRLWTSFRRRNGCEISRWDRFAPWLLPRGGATR